ncbi:MAG: hypothetical protein V4723_05570 [Pseudomonadota bacterium]
MKNLLIIAALGVLAGCATTPGQNYGQQRYAHSGDPSQWRVVSVTPVEPGTGARIASSNPNGSNVEYSSVPMSAPPPVVYQQAPVYVDQPAYFYPPVTLSLGFVLGRHWGFGHRGHRGYRRHR